MGRRMMRPRRRAPGVIDLKLDGIADMQLPLLHHALMQEEAVQLLLRVLDGEDGVPALSEPTAVADLAAGFAVERGLVDEDGTALAVFQILHARAVLDESDDLTGRGLRLVAEELGCAELLLQLEPELVGYRLAGARPGFARLGALPLHGGGEAACIDADAARLQRILGQIVGEAISVVELERDLAGQRVAALQVPRLLVEQLQPALERLAEAGLLELERLLDEALRALELVIGEAHLSDQGRDQTVKERLLRAQNMCVPHGAPHDAAEHVAPPLIRRQNAVGDEEGGGAQMIGDDAMARRMHPLRRDAGQIDRRRDQRAEEVDR